jgi:DnaJ homolog subfamily A member 5
VPQKEFVEQAWQKVDTTYADMHADLEWAMAEGAEGEEWECVVCGKFFKTEAAWDNHERSKKHLKEVEKLKAQMENEDEEFGLAGDEDRPDIDGAGAEAEAWGEPALTADEDVTQTEHRRNERPGEEDRDDSMDDGLDGLPSARSRRKGKGNKNHSNISPSPERPEHAQKRAAGRRRKGNNTPEDEQDLVNELEKTAIHPSSAGDGEEDSNQDKEHAVPTEMSKRDKRRAREAKKAMENVNNSSQQV